jgi:hypothetical protein
VVLGGWYLVWVREGDEKVRRKRKRERERTLADRSFTGGGIVEKVQERLYC